MHFYTAGSGAASSSVAMLAGIAIGVAALFAIIILVALILRRSREEARKRSGMNIEVLIIFFPRKYLTLL